MFGYDEKTARSIGREAGDVALAGARQLIRDTMKEIVMEAGFSRKDLRAIAVQAVSELIDGGLVTDERVRNRLIAMELKFDKLDQKMDQLIGLSQLVEFDEVEANNVPAAGPSALPPRPDRRSYGRQTISDATLFHIFKMLDSERYTHKEIAERTGGRRRVSRSTVSQIARGDAVYANLLWQWAKAHGKL